MESNLYLRWENTQKRNNHNSSSLIQFNLILNESIQVHCINYRIMHTTTLSEVNQSFGMCFQNHKIKMSNTYGNRTLSWWLEINHRNNKECGRLWHIKTRLILPIDNFHCFQYSNGFLNGKLKMFLIYMKLVSFWTRLALQFLQRTWSSSG